MHCGMVHLSLPGLFFGVYQLPLQSCINFRCRSQREAMFGFPIERLPKSFRSLSHCAMRICPCSIVANSAAHSIQTQPTPNIRTLLLQKFLLTVSSLNNMLAFGQQMFSLCPDCILSFSGESIHDAPFSHRHGAQCSLLPSVHPSITEFLVELKIRIQHDLVDGVSALICLNKDEFLVPCGTISSCIL